mgnify:CR=1 FL=1
MERLFQWGSPMHYQNTLRVGAAQINTTLGEVNDNLERHLALIADAQHDDVELLVLDVISPEVEELVLLLVETSPEVEELVLLDTSPEVEELVLLDTSPDVDVVLD